MNGSSGTAVMPAPVAGIHVFPAAARGVDGWNKSGHDEVRGMVRR